MNKTPFTANGYDENVRKVIPYYEIIYEQIIDLIKVYYGDKQVKILDTGCGSGKMAIEAEKALDFSEFVLCDPSQDMLDIAAERTKGIDCKFRKIGSEQLDYTEQFDVVTAIQSHHYFDRATRKAAVDNCFKALKKGGLFICFENTAPFTEQGKEIMLDRVAAFGEKAGRTQEQIVSHRARYGTEFFPLNISEHLELLKAAGFCTAEIFWHSYMQTGFYAIK